MSETIFKAIDNHFKKYRIIFWYDENGNNKDIFDKYSNPAVEKIKIENNEFYIKYRVLKEKPEQKYLIYSELPKPGNDENWLLDLNLAHFVFATDEVSRYQNELALPESFKPLIKEHIAFFRNKKERLNPLKKLLRKNETPRSFKYALVSVICSNSQVEREKRKELEEIILKIFISNLKNADNGYWKEIEKYNLADFIWDEIKSKYGYSDTSHSVSAFLMYLFREAFRFTMDDSDAASAQNAFTCIQEWQNKVSMLEDYKLLAAYVEKELNIDHEIEQYSLTELIKSKLFLTIDRKIISKLLEGAANETIKISEALNIIELRRESFWYRNDNECSIRFYYLCLKNYFYFINTFRDINIDFKNSLEGWRNYTSKYYILDTYYRKFFYFYQKLSSASDLTQLAEKLEKIYTNSYLYDLSKNWQNKLKLPNFLKSSGFPLQRVFFKRDAAEYLRQNKILFVVISDALRYEIGKELAGALEMQKGIKVDMASMIASVPTYTQHGMASLLPGSELKIDTRNGNVIVDNKSSAGIDGRNSILKEKVGKLYKGKKAKALKAEDFMELPLAEQEKAIRGYDLIYLFTNKIDSTGDNAKTESNLPAAVEREIDFIISLCKKIINLNRTHIIITADHGFLYQYKPVDETDFVDLEKSGEEYIRDRRYIIGFNLRENNRVDIYKGEELGLQKDIEVLIPKGLARIRKQGSGTRYTHGGTSIHELCIPLIKIRKIREDDIRYVSIDIPVSVNVITTGQIAVKFIQDEPVKGKVLQRTVIARFESEDGTVISNQYELVFDSKDPNSENRSRVVGFTLTPKADDYNNRIIKLKIMDKKAGNILVQYKEFPYRLSKSIATDF